MLRQLFQRAGAVALGTGLGQGLVLLATPFLARIYSPAEFGTLALLMTVGNVSMSVACLRYDIAMQSADDEDVAGLLVASMAGASALALIGAGLSALFADASFVPPQLAGLLEHPVLIGACILLVGLYQATGGWLLRTGSYGGVAATRVAQGGSFGILAAVPGLGLLWAHAASFGWGAYGLWRAWRDRSSRSVAWTVSALRHRKFPQYTLPGAVLDVVGYSLSTWVIATFYGRSAAGEISQVQRLVGAPLMLMSVSLGQILLRQTAELVTDRPQLRRLLLRLLRLLGLGAVGALLLLWFAGRPAISLVLGPQWRVEREVVVLVGAAVFVRACVSPLSSALLSARRFGLVLGWQATYFCSAALLMPWVARRVDFLGYVRFYAVHEAAFYGAYLYLIMLAVRDERCVESSGS